MKKFLGILAIVILAGVAISSQGRGTPSTLIVKTDANNTLLTASASQVAPVTQGTFATRILRTDSNGNLLVTLSGGVTPSFPILFPSSACGGPEPNLALDSEPTTGIGFPNTTTMFLCFEGTSSHIFDTQRHVYGELTANTAGFARSSTEMRSVLGNLSDFANFRAKNLFSEASAEIGATGIYSWNTRSRFASPANGQVQFSTANGTTGSLTYDFTDNPTCATNCGTTPTLDGVNSSFTLTMGATGSPASGFIVTFAGAGFAAAPQCHATMALAGMAVGKMILTAVTTTTTATFTTNGTAPANGDMYHIHCEKGSAQ